MSRRAAAKALPSSSGSSSSSTAAPIMIRPFNRDTDTAAVHALFSAGMISLTPALVRATLLPPSKDGGFMLLGLCLAQCCTYYFECGIATSVALLTLVAAALLLVDYVTLRRRLAAYVVSSLASDCADIEQFYRGGGGEFWCATAGGEVVGIIGAEKKDEEELELRRMSVKDGYQGRGIASSLVRHLEAFGSAGGFRNPNPKP